MKSWPSASQAREWPLTTLLCLFILWKTLILLVVFTSPGPGYDTSTSLLAQLSRSTINATSEVRIANSSPVLDKLVRWDAIYFTEVIRRGHVFEQEWAFGVGFSRFVSVVSTGHSNASVHGKALIIHSDPAICGELSPSFGTPRSDFGLTCRTLSICAVSLCIMQESQSTRKFDECSSIQLCCSPHHQSRWSLPFCTVFRRSVFFSKLSWSIPLPRW